MAQEIKNSSSRKQAREKARRTEKIELMLWKIGLAAVALAFVVGVGVTFFNMFKDYQASKPNYDVEEMVVGDLANVLSAVDEVEPEAVTEEALGTEEAAETEEAETEEAAQTEAEAAETEAEAAETEAEAAETEAAAGETEAEAETAA